MLHALLCSACAVLSWPVVELCLLASVVLTAQSFCHVAPLCLTVPMFSLCLQGSGAEPVLCVPVCAACRHEGSTCPDQLPVRHRPTARGPTDTGADHSAGTLHILVPLVPAGFAGAATFDPCSVQMANHTPVCFSNPYTCSWLILLLPIDQQHCHCFIDLTQTVAVLMAADTCLATLCSSPTPPSPSPARCRLTRDACGKASMGPS